MFTNKLSNQSRWTFSTLTAVLLFTIGGQEANAALLENPKPIDTSTNLDISWIFSSGGSRVIDLYSGLNWDVKLDISGGGGYTITGSYTKESNSTPVSFDGNAFDDKKQNKNVTYSPFVDSYTFQTSGSAGDRNLRLTATHAVPEPLTLLGSGLALGFGALIERKYSQKRNKLAQQREIEKV